MFETKAEIGDPVIILPIHWKHELVEKNKFHHIYGTVIGHHETKNPDGSIDFITKAVTENGDIYNNDQNFWQERSVDLYTMEEFKNEMFSMIASTNEKIKELEQQRKYMSNALGYAEYMKNEAENDRYLDY